MYLNHIVYFFNLFFKHFNSFKVIVSVTFKN